MTEITRRNLDRLQIVSGSNLLEGRRGILETIEKKILVLNPRFMNNWFFQDGATVFGSGVSYRYFFMVGCQKKKIKIYLVAFGCFRTKQKADVL